MSFYEKYKQSFNLHKSLVCLGLDSDISKIPSHLRNENNPILSFNTEIIKAVKNKVAAFKLNFAFYLSEGKKGIKALEKTIEIIPSYIPVILDVKVGDIGNTMVQYGKSFFENFRADAITVNPLMGEDVYTPLEKYTDKMIFLLVLTSNKSADNYLLSENFYLKIAERLNKLNKKQFGAVVGATNKNQLKKLREYLPETLFLIPGVGAQGGSIKEVVLNCAATKKDPLFLINSSRAIIFSDNSEKFAEKALIETEKLRDKINKYL